MCRLYYPPRVLQGGSWVNVRGKTLPLARHSRGSGPENLAGVCPMQPHSVKLGVTPGLSLECKFWLEDGGWNATIESLGISVHAHSFEAAKNDMEVELGRYLESLLREFGGIGRGRAA